MMTKLYEHAKTEYARVLRLSPNSIERHHAQAYMCFLRDFIAEHEGRDAETVQAEYEQPAWDDIHRRMFGGTAAEMQNNPRRNTSPLSYGLATMKD